MNEVALQEPPALVTAEGDPITTSTAVFDVPAAGEALVKLLLAPDFEPGPLGSAAWVEGGDKQKRLLGDVECKKGTLTLTTFSRARAARARQRMEEILGPLTLMREEHRDFDSSEAMTQGNHQPLETIDADAVPELQSWLQDQDRRWLDTSVPPLDGRTPRQAAADRRLRPRLRELLIDIENREARMTGGSAGRDVTWMWKELGLRRP